MGLDGLSSFSRPVALFIEVFVVVVVPVVVRTPASLATTTGTTTTTAYIRGVAPVFLGCAVSRRRRRRRCRHHQKGQFRVGAAADVAPLTHHSQ